MSNDFKGLFCPAEGTRIYTLTVKDAASGYLLARYGLDSPDGPDARHVPERTFTEYCQPKAICADNAVVGRRGAG